MDLKTKQLMEKNRSAFVLGVCIIIVEIIFGLLGLKNLEAGMGILVGRLVVSIILLVIYIFSYFKYKDKLIFLHWGAFCLIGSYLLISFFSAGVYLYALMFPTAIYIMFYMERKFTLVAAWACAIANIILGVKNMIMHPESKSQSFMQMLIAVFSSLMVYMVIKVQAKHSTETMNDLEDTMEKNQEVSNEVIAIAQELTAKFSVAKENADQTVISVEDSTNAVDEITRTIKETAESINSQTELTATINTNIQQVNEDTEAMKNASLESVEAVNTGMKLVDQLAEQATLTSELNAASQTTTQELNERIHDVEAIIGEILSISDQTNLLALNASIEAARAGEAGKGFAVVADEIRGLSVQTKDSVEKITDIINKLTANATEAAASMAKSIDASNKQNEMISETKEQISIVGAKNDALSELMARIAEEMDLVVDANTAITDSISDLSASSEEVAVSSENCNDMMKSSKESMDSLNELLEEINNLSNALMDVANN